VNYAKKLQRLEQGDKSV
jgi:hypothetical protein